MKRIPKPPIVVKDALVENPEAEWYLARTNDELINEVINTAMAEKTLYEETAAAGMKSVDALKIATTAEADAIYNKMRLENKG